MYAYPLDRHRIWYDRWYWKSNAGTQLLYADPSPYYLGDNSRVVEEVHSVVERILIYVYIYIPPRKSTHFLADDMHLSFRPISLSGDSLSHLTTPLCASTSRVYFRSHYFIQVKYFATF